MTFSIIIPTYNRLEKISKALASIDKIDFDVDDFEVIVVDDGSTDGTEKYISNLKNKIKYKITYIYQKNSGPSAARNKGIRIAKGNYVLIIDSDCMVDKNILKQYIKYLPDDSLGGIGGNILPEGEDILSSYLDYTGAWRPGNRNGEINYIVTANALFIKKVIEEVGFFDEDFRQPGGEDPEICERIIKKGYKLKYNPDAIVIHSHRTSIKNIIKTFYIQGKGGRLLAIKHPNEWTLKISFFNLIGKNEIKKFYYNYLPNHTLYKAIIFTYLDYIGTIAYYSGYCFYKEASTKIK